MAIDGLVSHDIHFASQQFFQFFPQSKEFPSRQSLKAYKEIHIALPIRLATYDRAEYAHVADAVFASDSEDLGLIGAKLFEIHGLGPIRRDFRMNIT